MVKANYVLGEHLHRVSTTRHINGYPETLELDIHHCFINGIGLLATRLVEHAWPKSNGSEYLFNSAESVQEFVTAVGIEFHTGVESDKIIDVLTIDFFETISNNEHVGRQGITICLAEEPHQVVAYVGVDERTAKPFISPRFLNDGFDPATAMFIAQSCANGLGSIAFAQQIGIYSKEHGELIIKCGDRLDAKYHEFPVGMIFNYYTKGWFYEFSKKLVKEIKF